MPDATIIITAFGKIPRMGDFVRVRASEEPTASFEGWIAEAMAYGEAKHGAQWPAIYQAGAIHAFVYRPPPRARSQSVFAGVLKPSTDAVGRKFPLVIGAAIPQALLAPSPHLMPLVLGDFFEQATAALLSADGVGSLLEFESHVGAVAPPRLEFADRSNDDYNQWAFTASLWSAWSTIYRTHNSPAPVHALYTINECLAPFRGVEPSTTPLSLRVPLGTGGIAAAVFWIDVVRRFAHWRATVPSFFFHFDGQAGTMLLQLGDTPPSSLVELWSPSADSDHVCDLTAESHFDPQTELRSLPPHVAQVLLRTDASPVNDLLAALVR